MDETDELAIKKAAPHLLHCFTRVFGTRVEGGAPHLKLAATYNERGETGAAEIAMNLINPDYLIRRNLAFVGSPETVTRQIKAAAEEGLFNTVMGEFNFGTMSDEDLMQSIRLFATRVIPELRAYEPF